MTPKCSIKGEPDFHKLDYDTLRKNRELANKLIYVYTDVDKSVVEAMQKVYKDMNCAIAEHVSNMPMRSSIVMPVSSPQNEVVDNDSKTLSPKKFRKTPLKKVNK